MSNEGSIIKENVTWGLVASGFPYDLFQEWEADCKKNYGNCRWMKVWHDHLSAKSSNDLVALLKKTNELESKLEVLEAKIVEIVNIISKDSNAGKQSLTIDGNTYE